MAFTAFNDSMLTLKFIPGKVVVELLFIKSNHIKFSAMMFAVTCETIFTGYAWIGMVSFFLTYKRLDFFVTLQALDVGDFLSQIMALRTIAHAFEFGVGIG